MPCQLVQVGFIFPRTPFLVSVIKADPLPLALRGCTYLAETLVVKMLNLISTKRVSLPNDGKQQEAKGAVDAHIPWSESLLVPYIFSILRRSPAVEARVHC